MEVVSLSPLPVASLLWQPRPGTWMFTFICKATFELQPGTSPLAEQQDPIQHTDRHYGDDPAWSVHAPSDLVPIRPRADVVVVGHAFAPDGKPVRSLLARLVVGEIDKTLEVHGDRYFTQDGALHAASFDRMPLLWERAAGGPDTINPVGVRPDAPDPYGRRQLPNLQPPGLRVATPDDTLDPANLAPIAAVWPARRQRLGRYAGTWSERDWARDPLPPDMDAAYFNAAPRDQQLAQLRDSERLLLENLHPEHPRLVTNLSGQHPRAFFARPGQAPQALAMRPDLLWIHTDRGLCTLTWRGQIPIDHPAAEGCVLIALEELGQTLRWEDLERLHAEGSADAIPGSEGSSRSTAPPAALDDEQTSDIDLSSLKATKSASRPPASALPFAPSTHTMPSIPRLDEPGNRLGGTPFTPAPAARHQSSAEWPAASPSPSTAAPLIAAPPMATSSVAAPLIAAPPMAMSSVAAPLIAAPPMAAPPMMPAPASAPPPAVAPPPFMRASTPRTIGEAVLDPSGSARPETSGVIAGAAGASSAAAAASAVWALPREQHGAAAGPATARAPAAPVAEAPAALLLLWYDPESVPRVRRQPAWRDLLRELEQKPLDQDLDDPAFGKDPMDIEDRREIFELLARVSATDAPGLYESLASAMRDDGKLVPPLRLVAGDLVFPFDELEALKATVATVTPLLGNDEQLRAAVTNAQEFLKLPDLRSAPAVAEGLTTRIREAWAQGKRAVPQGYLEAQTERALLTGRCYQRRQIFNGKHLRALAQPVGSQELIPTYLPEALADGLPLYQRFRVRFIAEVHPQLDQYEAHPVALRTLALARALPPPGRMGP